MDDPKSNGSIDESVMFDEINIPVPWGHIAGKWWGSKDKQPVIAIHGWQDNAGTFDNLAPFLVKENISVLCIDLPGHGFSSYYPQGVYYYIFWDGVHLLRRIVKYYNWKNIKVIGHSLGGAIAFLYAGFFPNEIYSFVSIDIASPALRNASEINEKIGGLVDKFLNYETLLDEQTPQYKYDDMVDIVSSAYNGSCTRDSCEIILKRGMRANDNGTFHFSRDHRLKVAGLASMTLEQALEIATKIKCKVLNIKATSGRYSNSPEYYDNILDVIEKTASYVKRVAVKGTHHVHLNNAESISQDVLEFLKV